MKRIVLFLTLAFITSLGYAQQSITGYSKKGYVHVTGKPPKPPYLVIEEGSVQLIDENSNMKIDADEQSFIYFQLINKGAGPGLNLKVLTEERTGLTDIGFEKLIDIGNFKPGETREIKIPVFGGLGISNSKAHFVLKIKEANGFDSNPLNVEIETSAFVAPSVQVVDYKVSSQKARTLQNREPFDLQVLVQNIGMGTAKNVSVVLPLPEGVFCLTDNDYLMIDKLNPGEQYLIEYNLVSNSQYSSSTIPIEIQLSERHGKYARNKKINLSMYQGLTKSTIIVEGKTVSEANIKIASLSSEVDRDIPVTNNKNPNRIALIIGNEDYAQYLDYDVNVDFARNDASVFRQYAMNVFGVEESNVYYLLDATAGQMNREINLVTAILEKLGDKGELIFYYAGHGFPDENSKAPYIVPVDVDATNLGSAIKLADVYKKFGNTGAARITLFLDACFSGGGRRQSLLASRGVSIKPKDELISGNMVVFSATADNQSALPYSEEKHGLFTYFLLKILQENKGNLSYGDLALYLTDNIGIESLRINGKSQDPVINTSPSLKNEWMHWKLN